MLKKLVIDRSKWACGPSHTAEDNCLLNNSGMCCLGFYARQAGYAAKTIRDKGMPSSIIEDISEDSPKFNEKRKLAKERFDKLFNRKYSDSSVAVKLAKINDSDMKQEIREAKIAAIFKKLGTRVIYTGKYRKKEHEHA